MTAKILLADAEVTFRETLQKVIQEEGMDITSVGNGIDAINLITKRPFAVAILDIQMPGADGIKVLQEIMKIRPETRVIMITAYGTVEMAVEAIKLGACDYVMKPVLFDDVLTKIRQHLKYLKLQEENQELKREIGLIRPLTALSEKSDRLPFAVKIYEKEHILRVLERYDWDKTAAAKTMGIGVSSLYRKIDKLKVKDRKEKEE